MILSSMNHVWAYISTPDEKLYTKHRLHQHWHVATHLCTSPPNSHQSQLWHWVKFSLKLEYQMESSMLYRCVKLFFIFLQFTFARIPLLKIQDVFVRLLLRFLNVIHHIPVNQKLTSHLPLIVFFYSFLIALYNL